MQMHKIRNLFGTMIILAFCAREVQSSVCSGDAGVGIAQAYAIAIAYPDSLPQFAKRNAAFFRENGMSIKCGRTLISQLRSAALSGPSPSSVREHAGDVAGRAGRPDLAGSLADDMLGGRMDMFQVASYLEQLIETLPAMVNGNLGPYHSTLVYKNLKYAWDLTQSLGVMSPQDLKALRDMTMEMSEWYVKNFAALVR